MGKNARMRHRNMGAEQGRRVNRPSEESRLKLANWMVDQEEAGVELDAMYYAQPDQVEVVERVRRGRSGLDEESLSAVAEEIVRLEEVVSGLVAVRRASGVSWQSIAGELGLERMAAVRRYG